MRPQAHDIIRTWAYDTIVKAWMHDKEIPWKSIVISGHVLSEAGGKISKSKGGADTTPEGLLQRYPADAIRFWTASGSTWPRHCIFRKSNSNWSKLITKLWNAFRFVKEHLARLQSRCMFRNNWAQLMNGYSHRSTETFKIYQSYLEKNEFSLALDSLEKFFWKDFCDNYLEIIKDQLFNPDPYTLELSALLNGPCIPLECAYSKCMPLICRTLQKHFINQCTATIIRLCLSIKHAMQKFNHHSYLSAV